MDIPSPKPLFWIASSHKDLKSFPDEVQDVMGRALLDAQFGDKHPQSRPLQGFGSAGVLEVVDSFDGNAYRTVYTITFRRLSMCCTHFRRNQRAGSRLLRHEIEIVKARIRAADEHYRSWSKENSQ
jgi:phage-related protein